MPRPRPRRPQPRPRHSRTPRVPSTGPSSASAPQAEETKPPSNASSTAPPPQPQETKMETLPGSRTLFSSAYLSNMEHRACTFSYPPRYALTFERIKVRRESRPGLQRFLANCLRYAALQTRTSVQRGQALILIDMSLQIRPGDLSSSFVVHIMTNAVRAIEGWNFYTEEILLLGDYHRLLAAAYRVLSPLQLFPLLESTVTNSRLTLSGRRHKLATFLLLSVFGASVINKSTKRELTSFLSHYWGQIRAQIEEIMAEKSPHLYLTNLFAVLLLIHNWMHDPQLYRFLKSMGEFHFAISIILETLKSGLEAYVLTSVGLLRNLVSCFKKDVIPFSSAIVHAVLKIMRQEWNEGNTVMCRGFMLFSVMAKYSGSAFQSYVPMILPKVFSALSNTTDETVFFTARTLLLELFLAIGPSAFSPYFKDAMCIVLDTSVDAKRFKDKLIFFCFLSEYSRAQIAHMYQGSEEELLLPRILPFVTLALDRTSLMDEDPKLDLVLGLLPKLMELTTHYIPEFDNLRDNLLIMIEELLVFKKIVNKPRITGVSVDGFCVILLLLYSFDLMAADRAGQANVISLMQHDRAKRTRNIIDLILDEELMSPVIVDKITPALLFLQEYQGLGKLPEATITLTLDTLRGVILPCFELASLRSPYETSNTYAVGRSHVAFLEMLHVPQGFDRRI